MGKSFSKIFSKIKLNKNPALIVSLLFLLFGFFWVALGDQLLLINYNKKEVININNIIFYETAKGFIFVVITTILLYFLIQNFTQRVIKSEEKYRDVKKNPKVWIISREIPPYLCLEIKDNGLGFDVEKNKDKIFGLYKRFHGHLKGKGIGLYLVKTQIEALEGKIDVDSKVDEGTSFKVYFKNKEGLVG